MGRSPMTMVVLDLALTSIVFHEASDYFRYVFYAESSVEAVSPESRVWYSVARSGLLASSASEQALFLMLVMSCF
jgi:hypothetical protein